MEDSCGSNRQARQERQVQAGPNQLMCAKDRRGELQGIETLPEFLAHLAFLAVQLLECKR
jgi:hypothetical protein